jgi:hypothetical protein
VDGVGCGNIVGIPQISKKSVQYYVKMVCHFIIIPCFNIMFKLHVVVVKLKNGLRCILGNPAPTYGPPVRSLYAVEML